MLRFIWKATRGFRMTPWRSPYLRWRIETYWGIEAESIRPGEFVRFTWEHRGELARFLNWADRMGRG